GRDAPASDRRAGDPGARYPVLVSAADALRPAEDRRVSADGPGIEEHERSGSDAVVPDLLRRVHRDGLQLLARSDLRAGADRALLWISAVGTVPAYRPLLRHPEDPALPREPCEHAILRGRVLQEGDR